MSTDTAFTRRSIMAAATLAAASVVTAASARDVPHVESNSKAWERTKQAFVSARAAEEKANEVTEAASRLVTEHQKTSPTRALTYTSRRWEIDESAAPVLPYALMTERTYEAYPPSLKSQPAYKAFVAELEAWRLKHEEVRLRSGYSAALDAQDQAYMDKSKAWAALLAFPVQTAAQAAEKLRLALTANPEEEDADELLLALAADLEHVAGI